ncbi:unnamed protein product, partial [marine sediment metagenome]
MLTNSTNVSKNLSNLSKYFNLSGAIGSISFSY